MTHQRTEGLTYETTLKAVGRLTARVKELEEKAPASALAVLRNLITEYQRIVLEWRSVDTPHGQVAALIAEGQAEALGIALARIQGAGIHEMEMRRLWGLDHYTPYPGDAET